MRGSSNAPRLPVTFMARARDRAEIYSAFNAAIDSPSPYLVREKDTLDICRNVNCPRRLRSGENDGNYRDVYGV